MGKACWTPAQRRRLLVATAFNVAAWYSWTESDFTEAERHFGAEPLPAAVSRSAGYYDDHFCSSEGSLHRLALDMMMSSSPAGSPSYDKFKRVLDSNSRAFVNMGSPIFEFNNRAMARMLIGYGISPIFVYPSTTEGVTLVETIFTKSVCPIGEERCKNQSRILIQTEQYIQKEDLIISCHQSPNCIILEFSDFNVQKTRDHFGDQGLVDSIVLLPVMHQSPSRMSLHEPPSPKWLINRKYDAVFFGTMTNRRNGFHDEFVQPYRDAHPDVQILFHKGPNKKASLFAEHYTDAKVCLLVHSYKNVSGGEYHRYSEFGPFGCIPVMEEYADSFGIDVYRRCGGARFATLDNLMNVTDTVLKEIDEGLHNDTLTAIVNWWKTGISWESLLREYFEEAQQSLKDE